ncbi:MAG: endonuclease domain-containing protein [Clostridia bacterium]|nr:endonuclease domain-containing protein [Clostridia bacterium]
MATDRTIYYNASLKPRAQELRRDATRQENHLWYDFLCHHPVRFRRQKQFARYIVDFYCSSAKLVIEIDGSQHYTEDGLLSDESRTAYLESIGLSVLRFTNHEIDHCFESVCQQINAVLGLL